MPTYTYDEDQTLPVDQVKFYLRQTGTTAATRDFSDEEIIAAYNRATVNTTRAKVYWTAYDMLSTLIVSHARAGGGLEKREISKLKVTYGGRSYKLEALEHMRDHFKRMAALYSRSKPRVARVLNISGAR